MTEQQQYDKNRDGRHDFRSGTVAADSPEIVDDQGHAFEHGRVSRQDEVDED